MKFISNIINKFRKNNHAVETGQIFFGRPSWIRLEPNDEILVIDAEGSSFSFDENFNQCGINVAKDKNVKMENKS